MFERLLVPVDGSACALRAARTAAELARAFGSRVTVLHVLYLPTTALTTTGAGNVTSDQVVVEGLERNADDIVEDARAIIDLPAAQVTTKVVHGHPAEEICRVAAEERCTLIAMGSRGLSEVRAFLTGSVSDKVNHHAPCSVLIVR